MGVKSIVPSSPAHVGGVMVSPADIGEGEVISVVAEIVPFSITKTITLFFCL